MAKYEKGELISWIEDERKRRLMWLVAFMLAVVGIVLASLLAPIVITHLVLAGIAYPAAFLITTLAAIALIVGIMRFLSLNFLYSDFVKILKKDSKKGWDKWYVAATIIGLGLGIVLSAFVGPVIISSLMLVGASHAFAMFITLIAGLTLLKLSMDLLLLPNLIKTAFKKATKLLEEDKTNKSWLGKFILAARVVGVGLGMYLSALVFPLITAALTSALVPHAVVILTAIVLSVGLIGACHSLLSKSGWLLADFVHLFSKIGKDQPLIEGASHTAPVPADSFMKKIVDTELPQKYEDGAALSDALVLHVQNSFQNI